jgi:hypothetical protein
MNPRDRHLFSHFWGHIIPPPLYYSVPRFDSGVVIPDHSAQRIAAAQAKRERKAAKRNTNQ